MKMKAWHWGIALGLSGGLHAGAAMFLLPKEPEVQVAGGESVEIALAGTAFADLTAAGTPADAIEPVSEAPAEQAPDEPDTNAVEAVEPVETTVAEVAVASSAEPSETAPTETETEAESAETEPQEPETAELDASETEVGEIAPAEPEETLSAIVDVPRPTPRPHYEPPKQVVRKKQKAQPAQTSAQSSAGSGGRDDRNARRGTANTTQSADTSGSRAVARAQASGDRAVSNYPGKIVSRLRRALRYPREARRQGARGEVHVAFTVAANGGVSGIRVVRGSGSPVLDEAAVATVRRAAPFPAIPPGAGRASWPFTVPLAFTRR